MAPKEQLGHLAATWPDITPPFIILVHGRMRVTHPAGYLTEARFRIKTTVLFHLKRWYNKIVFIDEIVALMAFFPVKVSPAQTSDLEDLISILKSYHGWFLTHLPDDPVILEIAVEITRMQDGKHMLETYHLARDLDGTPLGCIALTTSRAVMQINRFHVTRPGLGVGRHILRYALDVAARQSARYVELDTSKKMAAAYHLYGSNGFEDVTAITTYPEEGIVYLRKCL